MVIKGWDVGVATMKVGEKASLICKPDYAYGESGRFVAVFASLSLKFYLNLDECVARRLSQRNRHCDLRWS
jgi:FK506-binding protein 4/5